MIRRRRHRDWRHQDDEIPVLSPNILAALTATMGEEAKEEELEGVRQRQLGVKVDKEQERKEIQRSWTG